MALSVCNTKTNKQGRELVEHGTSLFPVACYHDDLILEHVPWHWHDELEAIVVSKGTATIAAGTKKYIIQQGEGFYINSGVLHAAWSNDCASCRFHSIVFHPRLVGGSMDSIFWQNYVTPLTSNPLLKSIHLDHSQSFHSNAIQAIERAWQSCVLEEFGYEFQMRTALSQFVLELSNFHPLTMKIPSKKALRNNDRMKIMLQFIQKNYAEPLNIATIAEQALISESECLRCFHSIIGTPPIQYLKQLRIQKAAELLLVSNDKIVDIGLQCGFQDTSYFTKSFREQKGYTPCEYRKHRGN